MENKLIDKTRLLGETSEDLAKTEKKLGESIDRLHEERNARENVEKELKNIKDELDEEKNSQILAESQDDNTKKGSIDDIGNILEMKAMEVQQEKEKRCEAERSLEITKQRLESSIHLETKVSELEQELNEVLNDKNRLSESLTRDRKAAIQVQNALVEVQEDLQTERERRTELENELTRMKADNEKEVNNSLKNFNISASSPYSQDGFESSPEKSFQQGDENFHLLFGDDRKVNISDDCENNQSLNSELSPKDETGGVLTSDIKTSDFDTNLLE
eukprot:GHVL01030679.1.p1 GENE.GHVL01030679.1~~GHVL01030679.1.p1  ORF type:complete len:275 (+),score=74.59 GHVL01030679.1:468-1292(+)